MQNNERLTMTLPEFAKACGISKGLVYELAKRHELPVNVLRFGRRLCVSRKAVEDLLADRGQDTVHPPQ